MATKLVRVNLTYFTDTGRLWARASEERKYRLLKSGVVAMADVVGRIRGLRDQGGQGALPGFEAAWTEGWGGYILIECDGQAQLLLPAEEEAASPLASSDRSGAG